MIGNYFRRRIGWSQNGPAGVFSPGGSGGDAGDARPGAAGHDPPLAGLFTAGSGAPCGSLPG
jgi:hypothetical protein